MSTIETIYQGKLRTEAVHIASGNQLITDAPVDNQGRGEAFSPTDLVCAALTSCMMTIMGIYASNHQINIDGVKAETQKFMQANPRKIEKVQVKFIFPLTVSIAEKQQQALKKAALTCPVALSLDPAIAQEISFEFA